MNLGISTLKLITIAFLSALCVACASNSEKPTKKNKNSIRDRTPDGVALELERDELTRAAQSPLYDFNFKRDEIPVPLANLKNIYAPPAHPSCRNLRRELYVLTAILGPDEIITGDDGKRIIKLNPSDAIESTMSSFIPFNDVVRYLSGAKGHERKLARAYFRGQARRSFLRGWEIGKKCHIPRPTLKPRKSKR